jgi:hypothetical protein
VGPIKTHSDILIVVREANRCIKILDNISLRGGFWPGACAAAIRDLQHALQKKVENDVSGARDGTLTRRYDTTRPSSGLNQARPPLANLNGRTQPPQFASNQQSAIGYLTSGGNSQSRNPPGMLNPAQAADLASLANTASIARTRLTSPSQNNASFNQSWPGLDGGLFEMDDQFNGFDDIFQLIDVPFHLNEHGTQTTW